MGLLSLGLEPAEVSEDGWLWSPDFSQVGADIGLSKVAKVVVKAIPDLDPERPMPTQRTQFSVSRQALSGCKVAASLDGGAVLSDSGALLLR